MLIYRVYLKKYQVSNFIENLSSVILVGVLDHQQHFIQNYSTMLCVRDQVYSKVLKYRYS